MKPRPSRSHVGSSSSSASRDEPRVLALLGDVGHAELPRDPRCLLERGRLVVRRADGEDLALVDELLQRTERLVERRPLVLLVVLVEVDVVGLQALQRCVESAADEVAGAVLLVVGVEHGAPLRREHDLVAPPLQHLAEDRLAAAAVAVDVGRVEEAHPHLERRVDDRPRRVGIDPTPEVVAAEPDDGDLERPECARPHPSTLLTHAQRAVRRTDDRVREAATPGSDPTTCPRSQPETSRTNAGADGDLHPRTRVRPGHAPGSDPRTRLPRAMSQGQSPGLGLAGRVRTARSRRARAASCRG